MNNTIATIDSHVHMGGYQSIEPLISYRKEKNLEAINIACITYHRDRDESQNMLAAILKLEDEHFYAFGSLIYPSFPTRLPIAPELNFKKQVQELMEIGFDGIKSITGKPTSRKYIDLPLDSPAYDEYYAFLQSQKIPFLWHINDPASFWDITKMSQYAIDRGWYYGGGGFLSYEEIYEEMERVMEKYPLLRVTFAHFLFYSGDPDKARRIFETYPNATLDITPGREMYQNFSMNTAFWHDFFTRYADRILLGTDVHGDTARKNTMVDSLRRFLCTTEEIDQWNDFTAKGIGLSMQDAQKICSGNFKRIIGEKPRAINRDALREYIDRYIRYVPESPNKEFVLNYRKNL